MGTNDPLVSTLEMANWSDYTTGNVTAAVASNEVFSNAGHFYLTDNNDTISRHKCIETVLNIITSMI